MTQDHALRAMFSPGARLTTLRGEYALEHRSLAPLCIRADRLLACDPLAPADRAPFTLPVPHGDFPVCAVLARAGDEERVAAAYVRFREREPARWASCETTGFDPTAAGILAAPGYTVESGAGCFVDAQAARAFFARVDGDEGEAFIAGIARAMKSERAWGWCAVPIDTATGSTLVAFSTGFGNGMYSSFAGYDAQGELVCLLTDFELHAAPPLRAARMATKTPWWRRWRRG